MSAGPDPSVPPAGTPSVTPAGTPSVTPAGTPSVTPAGTLTATLADTLSRTPFFGGLPPETMERLVGMLVEREFPARSTVFREGETGRSMYVVKAGELVANQAGRSGNAVRLMRFFEGDFFGETTLIEMQPRPFTVLVERDARLWELSNMDLYQLYRSDPKGYVLVLQNINRELCRRLRRAGNRITEVADENDDERTQIRGDGPKR